MPATANRGIERESMSVKRLVLAFALVFAVVGGTVVVSAVIGSPFVAACLITANFLWHLAMTGGMCPTGALHIKY